ncbi:hypothetical protein EBV26_21240, partial [bacterium]|nr:hypothetical protein [bacterium]
MKDIKGIISSHYTSLKTFYNDHVIQEVLRHAEHHVRDLKIMLENTPFMAEIFFDEEKDAKVAAAAAILAVQGSNASGSNGSAGAFVPREVDIEKELGEKVPHSTRKNIFTMYSVFDRNIVRNLYLFYFLSFMRTFVQLVVETPVTIYQAEPTRVIRRSVAATATAVGKKSKTVSTKGRKKTTEGVSDAVGAIARSAGYREDEDAERDDVDPHSRLYSTDVAAADKGQLLSEMDTLIGDKKALGQRVSELLVAYLRMIEKDKAAINFNLANIKEKLTRVKDKEKDGFVKYLGDMSVEQREVANLFKKHGLGIWSKGNDSSVYAYDADAYDEEREQIVKTAMNEKRLGRRNDVTIMNRDILMFEMMETDIMNEQIEREENDM